ncbi:MAG: sugar ABC transporter permease [Hyphomicrobiales bacterium]|nr:sugar ABC transporter permease [Hyphomicrobiales bacterium]MBV8439206.1 sugar ABC transporter permease [Hyphomicrobiales bacterium]
MTGIAVAKISELRAARAASPPAAAFVAPALMVLCAINVLPFLWSIGVSFFHFRADHLTTPPRFLGFGNYLDLITDPDIWEHFVNTGTMIGFSVSIQLVVGALLAFLFHRRFPGRRLVMMLVLAPMLLSTVAVGTFFSLFYDPTFGIVSAVVRPFTGAAYAPLGTPFSAMMSLVAADAWMWSPFVMLLLLAGLDGVPPYLLEAAEIDRASYWRRFWTVIFPAIRSVLLLALLFRTIESFNMFDLIYTITNGGPGTSTESVSTEIYDTAFVLFESGRASALGNLSVFVVIVLTRIYFRAIQLRKEAA